MLVGSRFGTKVRSGRLTPRVHVESQRKAMKGRYREESESKCDKKKERRVGKKRRRRGEAIDIQSLADRLSLSIVILRQCDTRAADLAAAISAPSAAPSFRALISNCLASV